MLREISFLPRVNMRHLIQLTWPLSLRQPCTKALQLHMTFYYVTVVASTIYFLSFCLFLANLNLYFLVLIPGLGECFKCNHQSLSDPVVTEKGDGSSGWQQTQLSLQTVGDSSKGAWLSCSWRWLLFCVVSLYIQVRVSPFFSPRAEGHFLKHQIPVCASET